MKTSLTILANIPALSAGIATIVFIVLTCDDKVYLPLVIGNIFSTLICIDHTKETKELLSNLFKILRK